MARPLEPISPIDFSNLPSTRCRQNLITLLDFTTNMSPINEYPDFKSAALVEIKRFSFDPILASKTHRTSHYDRPLMRPEK
jgi:hypothetical protein